MMAIVDERGRQRDVNDVPEIIIVITQRDHLINLEKMNRSDS